MLKPDGSYDLKVRGISNFLSILSLDKLLEQIPGSAKVTIDLSESRLVGFTVMEHLYEFQKLHQNTGGEVDIRGLESHTSTNNHKFALRFKTDTNEPLNPRQKMLKEMRKATVGIFKSNHSRISIISNRFISLRRVLSRRRAIAYPTKTKTFTLS